MLTVERDRDGRAGHRRRHLVPGPGSQVGRQADAADAGVGATVQVEFLQRVGRPGGVIAGVQDEHVAVLGILSAHHPAGLAGHDPHAEGVGVVGPRAALAEQPHVTAGGVHDPVLDSPVAGQRAGRHRVDLRGVGAVVPDLVQLIGAGHEVALVGAAVGEVIEAGAAERQRARRGQGELLVALAALHEPVGDGSRPGDGVGVRAGGISFRPRRRAITAGGQVVLALAVAGLQLGRARLR
jgi:hypothetical protein